jgi:phosphatidylglycerophosphate synthase
VGACTASEIIDPFRKNWGLGVMTDFLKTVEGFANNIDYKFHEIRKPITTPICKFFIMLHMKESHITATRFIILIAFLSLWIHEHYYIAISLLAINIMLDVVDGDLARILNTDSDVRKFEDVMVDNIAVVVFPLALIWQGLISGFLGAYYIFMMTLSWWLSVIRRNSILRSKWLFRAQASPFLFIARFCIVTFLMFLYALFKLDAFSPVMIAVSTILTLGAGYDYWYIIRSKPNVK